MTEKEHKPGNNVWIKKTRFFLFTEVANDLKSFARNFELTFPRLGFPWRSGRFFFTRENYFHSNWIFVVGILLYHKQNKAKNDAVKCRIFQNNFVKSIRGCQVSCFGICSESLSLFGCSEIFCFILFEMTSHQRELDFRMVKKSVEDLGERGRGRKRKREKKCISLNSI